MFIFVIVLVAGVFGQRIEENGQSNILTTKNKDFYREWTVLSIDKVAGFTVLKDGVLLGNHLFSSSVNYTKNSSISTPKDSVTINYSYIGVKNGEKAGTITMELKNVQFSDSGDYTLEIPPNVKSNVIFEVNALPKLIGDRLEPSYIINTKEDFVLTITISGKPQPNVIWFLNGKDYPGSVEKIGEYKFNYSLILSEALVPCQWKELSYTVQGYLKNLTGTTNITGNFNSKLYGNYTGSNFQAFRNNETCVTISWNDNDISTTTCEVENVIEFFNTSNSKVGSVKIGNNSRYDTCDSSLVIPGDEVKVRVVTTVSGNLNGTYSVLDTQTTDQMSAVKNTPPPTTTTTSKGPSSTEAGGSGGSIGPIIGGATGGVLLLILIVVIFYCLMKRKRAKSSSTPLQMEDYPNSSDRSSQQALTNERMYEPVDRRDGTRQPQAVKNDYEALDELPSQGATAAQPQDVSAMYAVVNKDKGKGQVIYSALGPGGGRAGPKQNVQTSIYAEAKEVQTPPSNPQSNLPQPMGRYKPTTSRQSIGKDNNGISDTEIEKKV